MYNEPTKNTVEGRLSNQPTTENKKRVGNYFEKYFSTIDQKIRSIETAQLEQCAQLVIQTHCNAKKLFFVGNGGSAAMASHLSVDFLKTAGIRAMNFNEADLITCFSNDYGYAHWVERALDAYADPGDLVFIISSGGCSPNMLNAAYQAKKIGLDIITATGFSSENPLRKLGDINLWVDSNSYNIVEMTHHVWLLSIVDYLVANQAHVL